MTVTKGGKIHLVASAQTYCRVHRGFLGLLQIVEEVLVVECLCGEVIVTDSASGDPLPSGPTACAHCRRKALRSQPEPGVAV